MTRPNYLLKSRVMYTLCLFIVLTVQSAFAQWEKIGPTFQLFRNDGQYGYVKGTLYIFGGKLGNGQLTTECSTLNTADPQQWVAKTPLPETRFGGYAAQYNGKFYLIGGVRSIFFDGLSPATYQFSASVLEYDPATDTYTEKTPIPRSVYKAAGAVIGSKVYMIAGGASRADEPDLIERSLVVQVYDMATDEWSTTTDAPFTDNDHLMATAVGNTIYYLGNRTPDQPYGYKGIVGETIEWSPIADCPGKPFAAACGTMNNTVYVAAGVISGNPSPNTYHYDIPNNAWLEGPKLPEPGFFVPVMPGDGNSLYYISGTANLNTYRLMQTTDVAEPTDGKAALHIYPHPASDAVTIELPSHMALASTLTLFSATGEEILRQTITGTSVLLDVHTLAPGLYTIRYTGNGSTLYRPLIVK